MDLHNSPSPITAGAVRSQPSILRIIITDYSSFLIALLPLSVWIAFLLIPYIDKGTLPAMSTLLFPAVLTVIFLVALIWRIRLISSTFEHGVEVNGTISDISFFRDRGRISYIYIFQGQKYLSSNAVMRSKRTAQYSVGDNEAIVLIQDKPKQAFIRNLYL